MIGHQVPFFDLAFLALRELAEYTAQVPSDLPKQQLLAVLWREHEKYSVAEVIGFLKGKSSIWIVHMVERKLRKFLGYKSWARGYFVSTIGRDEEMIRAYIRNQDMADKQLDQLQLKLPSS